MSLSYTCHAPLPYNFLLKKKKETRDFAHDLLWGENFRGITRLVLKKKRAEPSGKVFHNTVLHIDMSSDICEH